MVVSAAVKAFISAQLQANHSREDYYELLTLAALMIGLDIKVNIRKPSALHRARWMAKSIYSLKIELVADSNKRTLGLTSRELDRLKRFNRFVVHVYIESGSRVDLLLTHQ
jgi:hypothetical protein